MYRMNITICSLIHPQSRFMQGKPALHINHSDRRFSLKVALLLCISSTYSGDSDALHERLPPASFQFKSASGTTTTLAITSPRSSLMSSLTASSW